MADKKISQLTGASTPLGGTEVLPIVQSGATVKVSIANVTAGRSVATADVYAVTSGTLNQVDPVVTAQTGATTYGGLYAVKDGAGDQRGFRQKVYKSNVGLIDSVTYDSAGNVGVNTTSPSTYGKHVVNNDNGSYAYVAVANDQSAARIRIKNTGTGGGDYAFVAGENNVGNTGLTLLSVGGSTLWALDDGSGNIAQKAAAKGINFTANTPAAGMTSRLLNWYEQGTWTPTDASGAGLIITNETTATYTRVGRLVTVQWAVKYPVTASAAQMTIGGLPFTVASGSYHGISISQSEYTTPITGAASPGSTNISMFTYGNSAVTNSNFSNLRLRGSLTYSV